MAREKVQTEFTQEEVEAAFDRLEAALVKYGPLPCEDGSKRVALAGEFMLMQADGSGKATKYNPAGLKCLRFKHIATRNYLYVLFNGSEPVIVKGHRRIVWADHVVIPAPHPLQPFAGGYFDNE